MAPPSDEAAISLARVVLDTVDQVRTLAGEGAADPRLAPMAIRSVALSIPCDAGAGPAVLLKPSRPLTLGELRRFLAANDRQIVLDRERLRDLPPDRLSRIELTVDLAPGFTERRKHG
jgi:hypothetical protein